MTGGLGQQVAITLAPAGRVTGRLVSPGNEPIRGVTVRAASQVGGYEGSGQTGSAVVACDEHGRFEIPAIAAGMVTLDLEFEGPGATPLRGIGPKKLIVQAGRATEVTIPLRETVHVRGLVRQNGPDGTSRPIAGVKVILNGHNGGDRFAVTDGEGRFAGRIPREENQPYGWPVRTPSPFFAPANMTFPRQNMPLRGVTELELSPIVLARGVDVRGAVVGEDGKPVAGAEVEAIWSSGEGQTQDVLARTDPTGAFTLRGVDPLAELNLTAWDGFASTALVTLRAEDARTRPIALTISPRNATPINGRVVDSAGKPIAGASIRLWRQARAKDGRVILADPIADIDHSIWLHTDQEGRYRTKRRFPAHGESYAEAFAPGRLSARSPAVAMAEQAAKPPVLVLRRVQAVEGRVLDRQGNPVAGAVVRQSGDGPMPTETLTSADGRFRLPGVLEGPALIFASRDGYRPTFSGCSASTGAGPAPPLEVTLARTGEPPVVTYRTLPPALPIAEEKALALRLLLPYAERVIARGGDPEKFRLFVNAAAIDPLATIERMESMKFADADYLKLGRVNLAEALAIENLDEATALLEAGEDAEVRAGGYAGICDVRRDLPADQMKDLLAQAELNVKSVKSPPNRMRIEAQVADHWLDLGETQKARALLDDALRSAGTRPRGPVPSTTPSARWPRSWRGSTCRPR